MPLLAQPNAAPNSHPRLCLPMLREIRTSARLPTSRSGWLCLSLVGRNRARFYLHIRDNFNIGSVLDKAS